MSSDFQYKDIDEEGLLTLDVVSSADKFNRWMFDSFESHTSGKILEIGSGIGNISEYFLSRGSKIYLSDIRQNYCQMLEKKFSGNPHLGGIINMDIVDPEFDTKYKDFFGYFDSIFALNVVEHIENDLLAIENCKKLLKKGGRLIILVPAYQFLYNQFDRELFHYRRYNKKRLISLFEKNSLHIVKSFYFNMMGIMGWYVSGKLQKNKTIPKDQMKLYNLLVPIFKIIDKITLNRIGLSVVVIGRK